MGPPGRERARFQNSPASGGDGALPPSASNHLQAVWAADMLHVRAAAGGVPDQPRIVSGDLRGRPRTLPGRAARVAHRRPKPMNSGTEGDASASMTGSAENGRRGAEGPRGVNLVLGGAD